MQNKILPLSPDSLVKENTAAGFLDVSVSALQKWRVSGTGPLFVRISSRCVRYRVSDLIEWYESRVKISTSAA